jgi:SAM-dependent methyltransferase
MRTYYEGHDLGYRTKHARGERGWTNDFVAQENFDRICNVLPNLEPDNNRILDLGCGSAEMTRHYHGISSNITGIDISPFAIAWAKEKEPELSFVCENILKRDVFCGSQFDLICDSNCLHCIIGDDRDVVLRNTLYWLSFNGYLIIHTMCNEPVGDLKLGYSESDRIIYQDGIATRYLGKADDILAEVEHVGYKCIKHIVYPQTDGPDMLVTLHQKDNVIQQGAASEPLTRPAGL